MCRAWLQLFGPYNMASTPYHVGEEGDSTHSNNSERLADSYDRIAPLMALLSLQSSAGRTVFEKFAAAAPPVGKARRFQKLEGLPQRRSRAGGKCSAGRLLAREESGVSSSASYASLGCAGRYRIAFSDYHLLCPL